MNSLKRKRSHSCNRRSSILLQDGTKILMDSSLYSMGSTAKFLEKMQRKNDNMNEAVNLVQNRIKSWHSYESKLRSDSELHEKSINKPFSKPNFNLHFDLLDVNEILNDAFKKVSTKNVDELTAANEEYINLEKRDEESQQAENELKQALEEKQVELKNDIRKIDKELANLQALCIALGWKKQIDEFMLSFSDSR